MELVKIFIAGGVFCMFGEVLWAKTGLGVVKTLMVCIAAGVALDVAGILGPVIGFGQEGFTVTIYGAGASIFDGVMGSVRDHGHGGRTGIPVSRDQGEIAYHRGKTRRLPLSEIESGSL